MSFPHAFPAKIWERRALGKLEVVHGRETSVFTRQRDPNHGNDHQADHAPGSRQTTLLLPHISSTSLISPLLVSMRLFPDRGQPLGVALFSSTAERFSTHRQS